jgi:natural product biosynthesis luciferase-like monooxygenase protein/non-ribosomal peptide synthase protein (TIGR01720 family)/FkbM family methyltransferase
MAIVGGDKLQNTHIETLRKINPNIKIYNEYGPTESTVGCTIKEISTEVEEVLIGRPIANTKIYILNESNQLLPKGVVGEIYIAGYGLAKGYLNQVKLTADKFIQNPFEKGTKLYKTGDLGRWLDTGEIDFQGRQDEQLKIKGYRIELGEIETVLSTHNAVDDAAILVRESDTNEKDLVAYVVPNKKVAQTVHNVLLSAPLELEFDAELYEMENGVSIYAYNRSEVKMLYTEVFDLKTYYKNGISIPANATIVDIGANVGSFSIFSMLTFENPTIYSFEPLAPIFSLLEKNVSLYEGNVKVFNVGISDREEEAVFDFYPYATVLSGRHSENYQVKDAVRRFIDNTQETQTEEVSDDQMEELLENRLMNKKYTCQLKSLSQVITENSIDHIDLLKIDAENAEMDIINGIQKEDWAKIDQMVIEVYNVDDRLEKIKAILLENSFNVSVYQSEELEGTKFFDVYCIKEHVASTSTKSQNKIDPNFWYGTDSLMQSIQARMVDNLPNYMIPTDIVLLDKMPLTTNGKLDRNALVELENIKRVKKIDFVSPQSERQRVLAAVWSDVLKREEISIKDSFYNLGGDSIKSIQVVARLKQKGYTLKVEHILRTPILEDLALLMEETTQFVAQDEIIGTVALTPIQQWFFESEGIQSHHHFNQSVILKSANLIDHGLLEKCLIDLTRHHDALRMVYKQVEYGWDQYNQSSKQKSFTLDFCDLSESENALDQLKEKGTELQTGISLAEGPLFKVVHFRLKDGDRIGLIVHHLVVDGVSWRILLEDLSTLYTAYSTGKTPVLPLKTDAFQKWALTQKEYANSKELTQERHYWEDVCKSKIVELPKDKSGIVSTGINASDSFHLDKQTTERLQTEVHKVYGTEINDVLLTALGLAIKETFKVDKTVLKMEGHGREDIFDNIDINRTIGWFTTVYPFVLDVSKSTSEIVNLVHVKESLRKIPNKGIGYGTLKYLSDQGLTEELAPEVTFNYLGDFGSGVGNTEDALFEYGTEDLGPNVSTDNQNDAVLDVSGMLLKGELHLSVGYSTEQYRANTIEDLMASYQKNLKHLIDTLSEEQTVKLTPSDLTYSGLTVEELALLNADDNVEDVYELSPLQEGIYYHWLKDESSELYFEQIAYSIQSKGLKIEALREAYQQLIERHDVLRTHFTSEYGGRSLQVVKKKAPVNFSSEKITIESTDQLVQIRKNDREKGFDLNTGSQMRLSVLELSEGHYEFIWSFHHILMDGWCASILIYEMNALLRASHDHKSPSLHTPVPYSEYIKWLRKVDRKTSLNYWKATLEGYAELARIPSVKKEIASAYNHESGYISIHGELFNNSTKLCAQLGITQNTLIQGVWGYLLSRYNDTNDVVYGAVVSGRPSELNGVEEMIGLFINTIPVRVRYDETDTPMSLLQRMHEQSIEASTHHYVNLAEVQAQSELGADLINHIILFENYAVKEIKEELIGAGESSINVNHINVFEQTNFDFNLIVKPLETSFDVNVAYNANAIEKEVIARLLNHFVILLQNFTKQGSQPLKSIELLAEDEKRHLLHDFNDTKTVFQDNKTLTQLFEEQVAQSPDEVALVYEDVELTFSELDKKANQLGHYLKETYAVRPDELIGIQLERSEWMLIAILGVLKSGGAYVPIATDMPQTRVDRILEDSNVLTLLDEVALDVFRKVQNDYSSERVRVDTDSSNLAYVIYTSGSTGMPKGVMIEHKNVANFFRGMTDIFGEEKGTFLSMTNFTFDISVLELLWTLTRGYKVVIQGDALRVEDSKVTRPLDFSLFYFGNSNHKANNYQLLMEGAKYADENGYHAVWTPERHFNEFGGLYPNSAITGSALAAVTKNIGIRAGSVVFPLHHPIRIAEDWSVIDNLSGGRAGIACASGWHLNDFVLAPHNYENRHQVMYDSIAIIKKLWRGEKVSFENGNGNQKAIEIFPRPIQQELPIWITSAGSLETFISAGKIGANILTHLLGESVEGLTEKIKAYRRAYSESGFDVMNAKVTLMLHTYIDDEENLDKIARKPFIEYLKSSAGLLKNLVSDIDQNAELDRFSEDEMEAIYERAYRRFVAEASMVGTEETCLKMMKQLSAIGVDEIAALIDFGVEFNAAMDSLKRLTKIKKKYAAQNQGYSVFEQIKKHEITHLQITPSMGTLLNQYLSKDANWNSLKYLLLGGERATIQLVNEIHEKLPGVSVYNMYGPTETTIWSTVKAINRGDTEVEIGNPIANTEIFILDKSKRLVPIGIQGEIYIGGKGVARGYTDIQKTEENFIENPFADGEKIYRTGDYGYWLENGSIYYVGRKDEQVKLRGYRIELGEIEHALCEHPSIESAVVKIVGKDNQQLVAYIVSEKLDDVDELRIFLRSRLPHYMIPNHFQKLDKLPLNNNGKIDRKSLPDLSEFSGKVEYVEPRNETEKILAEIWKRLLKTEKVSILDDFFAQGGHSLTATQVIIRIDEIFGVKIDLRNFLEHPTIESLAIDIETLQWAQASKEELNVEGDELII